MQRLCSPMRFDVLLQTLASQERLRTLVEQTAHLAESELLDSLVREFEQVCERYKSLSDFAAEASSHAVQVAPLSISVPDLPLCRVGQKSVSDETSADALRRQLEDVQRLIAEEVQRDWDTRAGEIRERITRLKVSQLILRQQLEAIEREERTEVSIQEQQIAPQFELRDDHRLYLYGIAAGDNETGRIVAYRVVDTEQSLLVCTHCGVKIVFAIVPHDRFPMTTTGTLLLGKEESFTLRSLHETTLNAIHVSERLVPFTCGTLVNGKHELLAFIERSSDEWKKRLRKELAHQRLRLRLYASDEAIGKTLGKQGKGRMSVKLLEKILKRERTLAETVHSTMQAIADSSSIESVVGISGGFSNDWKMILESSYSVADERRGEFFSAVRRLEREHNHRQLMFEIGGSGGRLAFVPAAHDSSV